MTSVRISAPNERAAPASALLTPPMPPRGKPHSPVWPSPLMSPMWWCSITYAVPAERGPAQVPMTPETDSTPLMASDSKASSTRSAMLDVISRVMSTALRASTSLSRRSSRACRARSAGRREPTLGGMSPSRGPRTLAISSSLRSQTSIASASLDENFWICSRRRAWSAGSWRYCPSRRGAKYGPCG